MAEDQGNSVDKLVYFLIGAGIGAVTALLFAPKAGKDLQAASYEMNPLEIAQLMTDMNRKAS